MRRRGKSWSGVHRYAFTALEFGTVGCTHTMAYRAQTGGAADAAWARCLRAWQSALEDHVLQARAGMVYRCSGR